MPITLEKLFSPTLTVPVEFLGETVNVTWAPFRYTGEMQELAERLTAEESADRAAIAELRETAAAAIAEAATLDPDVDGERIDELNGEAARASGEANTRASQLDHRDKAALRQVLATLLVAWDVLDGKKPIGTDVKTLARLPDVFLRVVFMALAQENQADPQNAPSSGEPSSTETSSAPSQPGMTTSEPPASSGSRRSSSTNGRAAPHAIPSGAPGR